MLRKQRGGQSLSIPLVVRASTSKGIRALSDKIFGIQHVEEKGKLDFFLFSASSILSAIFFSAAGLLEMTQVKNINQALLTSAFFRLYSRYCFEKISIACFCSNLMSAEFQTHELGKIKETQYVNY